MSNLLTFPVFFLSFLFSVAGLFFFLFSFFFLLLLFFQHVALFSSFLSVLSAPVRSSYCWWFVFVFISFYFFQFQHFSLSLFVDVLLWCLKLSFTVTRFVLNRFQLNYIIIQRPHDRPLDLWNRMFKRHQAEITVMQFRGYSLPMHHCSGTMGPSPCPIS